VLALGLAVSCTRPPVIDGISVTPHPVPPSTMAEIRAEAHSPSQLTLLYTWSVVDAGDLLQASGNPVQYRAPKLTGVYHVALQVMDAYEKTAHDTVAIEVANPCGQ
jgi:hypothetical protein